MGTKEKTTATVNACKLCTPLGACLAFKGIKNSMTLIHGSQGCATYIRRYIISHFREPMDIASSNFSEETTIFGGEGNFLVSIENVAKQYSPELIGVATSCLAETIGEDVKLFIHSFAEKYKGKKIPHIIHVSTPSYAGTHADGFHLAVKATIEAFAQKGQNKEQINILPGFISPADLRYIKEILTDFNLEYIMLPDYSETLDSPIWDEYKKIPEGGTSVDEIKTMGQSKATIELGQTIANEKSGGYFLEKEFDIPNQRFHFPIGLNETDRFFKELEKLSGKTKPHKYEAERGRLIDAYVDGHKYLFGKKAIVYGEADLVIGISQFLFEIGIIPVLIASGEKTGKLENIIKPMIPSYAGEIAIKEGLDFLEIENHAELLAPDIIIGNSKGYKLSRKLKIPLIRTGFPIHDRIGGQRILHLGYRGTQNLFDTITNALLEYKQENSPVGYSYL